MSQIGQDGYLKSKVPQLSTDIDNPYPSICSAINIHNKVTNITTKVSVSHGLHDNVGKMVFRLTLPFIPIRTSLSQGRWSQTGLGKVPESVQHDFSRSC